MTPVDFHTPDNLVALWARGVDVDAIGRLGNVPGSLLNAGCCRKQRHSAALEMTSPEDRSYNGSNIGPSSPVRREFLFA
ncbi:MAG TPA: hypothetical protein VMD49_11400 [Steroidobacteraceae bacterium]|nr:hypothetical protein [Steroidobacteraceae bacterium]